MTLNRTIAPGTEQVKNLSMTHAETFITDSGIPLHFIHDPNTDVLKVEMIFNAGKRQQQVPYQATFTNQMLLEGTSNFSSKAIAESLDYYGAYFQNKSNADDASLALFCLPRHLDKCIPYFSDILLNSIFPESELNTLRRNAVQRMKINEGKTSFWARKEFYSSIFGKENPYGSPVNQEDIQKISRETLVSFYDKAYRGKIKYVLVSGDVSKDTLQVLNKAFSELLPETSNQQPISLSLEPRSFTKKIELPNTFQSAIRIGRTFPTRVHPDYRKFQVLNLALGGYFGSRLMSNIREEKGLTYGIYSAVESYQDAGAFYIDTDVNNELVGKAIHEIYFELSRLRNEPIPETELQIIKNYMLGSFMRSIGGPFDLIDRYKILLDFGLGYEYYAEFIDTIKSITASELQQLANVYLKQELLTEIVVGKS